VERTVSVTVPAITAGAVADVALTADRAFKGKSRVRASFSGSAMQANAGIVGAAVTGPSTGVVTIRFIAGTGNVAGGAQPIVITAED
jgi:hypothetical protein